MPNTTEISSLINRKSCGKQIDPMPTNEEFSLIMQAAMRAPDHFNLKPWRFIRFTHQTRHQLGEMFLQSAIENQKPQELDEQSQQKFRNMPLRSPCVLLAYCHHTEHPKVPLIEQKLATAAAITNILHATHQLDYAAIWRTGSLCYNPTLHQKLNLAKNQHIIGFIYIGSKDTKNNTPEPKKIDWQDYLQDFANSSPYPQ
jgi:nitroreductase